MTQLTEDNKISIVDIAFYVPSLFIAILLCWRHGFGRSAGWLYLIILSLMRILGGSMQLATISSPTNFNLIIGAQTLQNVGLSPLILILLGLVSRTYLSIPQNVRPQIPNARILRIMQLLVVVGLILSIVGGVNTGNQIGDDITNNQPLDYEVSTESKAGIALMLVGYVLVAGSALLLAVQLRDIPRNETRLLLAVFAALPFVLVRLIYSCLTVFDTSNPDFRQYGGSANAANYVAGMCTAMEIAAVVIFEVVGLTLPYVPHNERQNLLPLGNNNEHALGAYPDNSYQSNIGPQGRAGYYPKQNETA